MTQSVSSSSLEHVYPRTAGSGLNELMRCTSILLGDAQWLPQAREGSLGDPRDPDHRRIERAAWIFHAIAYDRAPGWGEGNLPDIFTNENHETAREARDFLCNKILMVYKQRIKTASIKTGAELWTWLNYSHGYLMSA